MLSLVERLTENNTVAARQAVVEYKVMPCPRYHGPFDNIENTK